MYVLKDGDGKETPITYTHHESYPGEARDIILSFFCVDTALYDEYETMDTVEDKEMVITTKDYIPGDEIQKLESIEKHAIDDFWETVTVDSLKSLLNAEQVKEDCGDAKHQLKKDEG